MSNVITSLLSISGILATKFVNTNLYIKDTYLGEYTANIVSTLPPTPSIISVSPNKKFYGKAIGLFNLDYVNQLDNVLYQSLYLKYKDVNKI